MIKKVNILIVLLLVAMFVMKSVEILKAKNKATTADGAAEAMPEKSEVSDLSPVVYFVLWPGFAQINPITNHNGYFLDIVRAIFPNARFVEIYHDEVKTTLKWLQTNPQAITVSFGELPQLAPFPRAPTPIGKYSSTLVTLRSNPWKYDGPSSLKKLKIGVTGGYMDFPVVQKLVDGGLGENRVRIFDDIAEPYRQMFEGEIDAVIETYEMYYEQLQGIVSAAVFERLKRSVRIDACDVYFRMSNLDTDFVERMTRDYEAGMKRITESGELRRIQEYYGFGE